MDVLLIWVVCAMLAAGIASAKGRSSFGWLLLGLLFGPLAVLGIAIASRDTRRDVRAGLQAGTLRPCPCCREAVQREASRCRFCGSEIAPLPPLPSLSALLGRPARSLLTLANRPLRDDGYGPR